jgi:hypothetical protein
MHHTHKHQYIHTRRNMHAHTYTKKHTHIHTHTHINAPKYTHTTCTNNSLSLTFWHHTILRFESCAFRLTQSVICMQCHLWERKKGGRIGKERESDGQWRFTFSHHILGHIRRVYCVTKLLNPSHSYILDHIQRVYYVVQLA